MTEAWILRYEGFEPEQEGLREALCALGNGYFCTRGAAVEADAGATHYPGTYLAGGYNRLDSEIGGRTIENEDLVNVPNWLCLTFRTQDDPWFHLKEVELSEYQQELDLRHGLLTRRLRCQDAFGRITRVTTRRFVHMANKHLAGIEMVIEPENWSGRVQVRSALDGRVTNSGVARYRALNGNHLEQIEDGLNGDEEIYLKVRTRQSQLYVAQAARTRLYRDGKVLDVERHPLQEEGYVGQVLTCDVEQGHALRVEKIISLYTSRDRAIPECGAAARAALRRAGSFAELLASQESNWGRLWERFDIELDAEDRVQLVLRLHIFHLLQTTSPNVIDLDVGVPARGLHGEAYRGHIFWDEVFIFPLLTLRAPDVTRSLLLYRYRRLNEARWNARRAGYRGAMYPWQSSSDGREETQVVHLNPKSGRWLPDNSSLQRHVNAAIAYNVCHYARATGDMDFMSFHGAEMILEIARFWASASTYNPKLERYEILRVMGPDEYHDSYPDSEEPGLNNNAYTNVMAVWCLARAVRILDQLDKVRRDVLCERLEIRDEEIELWDRISRRMRLAFHGDGIISQFEGYDDLEEFDWEGYREKYGNIQRLDRILEAEGDSANRYKVSKQADVLMLFYLFSMEELSRIFERMGYTLDDEALTRNIDYYWQRTSNGSTLSGVVHAWVLARADRTRSWELFAEALESDVADVQGGTTAEGIHLGAMSGTVDLVQRCYSGLEVEEGTLRFDPSLPERLGSIRQRLSYRGHWINVHLERGRLTLEAVPGWAPPVKVAVKDDLRSLAAGETLSFEYSS